MRIIYFSICAIFNSLAMIFTIYLRKFHKGAQNVLFLWTCWISLTTSIIDFFCTFFQNWYPDHPVIRFILTTLYFVFRNYCPVLFTTYIFMITNSIYKFYKKVWLQVIFIIPYTVTFLCIVLNIFTGWMFFFDENLQYHRGPLALVNYTCAAFYLTFGVIYLFLYRKLLNKTKVAALITMYVLLLLSVLIQFIEPTWLIEMFFTSLSLIIVMILVQRPEEYTDANLGIYNFYGFSVLCSNLFINKSPTNIVIIKANNYDSLEYMLDSNQLISLEKICIKRIESVLHKDKVYAEIYYINKGRFAVTFNGKYCDYSYDFANQVIQNKTHVFDYKTFRTELKASVCHISMPGDKNNDFDNYQSMRTFIEQFQDLTKDDNTLISLNNADIKKYFETYVIIDSVIQDALENDKFEMYYQPIYSVTDNKIISAEALIRLKDESHGYISPEIFIPAAERSGAIIQIGEFVLDSVCSFVASEDFKKTGLEYVEVNLSVSQCMQPDIAERIEYYIRKYNIDPKLINLEITETSLEKSAKTMVENIKKLSDLGFTFSLDDYGTGYSNIKRIVTLPLKIIKFDKTFVNEVSNPQMQIVLKNNINMIKEMKKEIVVEGIETKDMLDIFEDYNCDFIQGFYFSRPIPKSDFCKWVQDWKETKSN